MLNNFDNFSDVHKLLSMGPVIFFLPFYAYLHNASFTRKSWKLFQEALASDLMDTQEGTTSEGIHLGAMAGTVDIVQRCFIGMEIRRDVLWFNPLLPKELGVLIFRIRYRGHMLKIKVDHQCLQP